MPKKGTAEYDDVKHVQAHEKLPSHLEKKAPFPAKALEQLRAQEEAAKVRSEIAKREKVIAKIEEVKQGVRPIDKRAAVREKEYEEEQIAKIRAKLRNFKTYWPDHWAKSTSKEKLTAYNELENIMGAKLHKEGFVYKALKDELDSFEKPDFIVKGYKAWLAKGGKSDVGHLNSRVLASDIGSGEFQRRKKAAKNVIEHAEAPAEIKVPKLPEHVVKKMEKELEKEPEAPKPKGSLTKEEKTAILEKQLKMQEEALHMEARKKKVNQDKSHLEHLESTITKLKALLKSGSY